MQIARDKVVTVDYTLTDEGGHVLDSSTGHGPLAYLHGVGGVIPGLERALEGQIPGNHLVVKIAPEDAYGQRDESLVESVPRAAFQGVDKIEAGMQFQAKQGEQVRMVTIVGVEPETVRVDANHPLAGKTLNFDVTVVDVRDATKEEIQHRHVHGPQGHQH